MVGMSPKGVEESDGPSDSFNEVNGVAVGHENVPSFREKEAVRVEEVVFVPRARAIV